MRLQYAVLTHEFQDGEWEGVTNLYGVRHKLFATYEVTGASPAGPKPVEGGPRQTAPVKLVISLVEGAVGRHTVLAAVRRPGGGPSGRIPPVVIDWDAASPTFFVVIEFSFQIYEDGIYEFSILVDGEPIGTLPMPVELLPVPI